MADMPAVVIFMGQCLLYFPMLNLVVIGVLLLACCQMKKGRDIRSEEKEVFLNLAKLAPLIFIGMHLYFTIIVIPPLFLLSIPHGLSTTWFLENMVIILLWLIVKFHYLRPIEVSFKKKHTKLAV